MNKMSSHTHTHTGYDKFPNFDILLFLGDLSCYTCGVSSQKKTLLVSLLYIITKYCIQSLFSACLAQYLHFFLDLIDVLGLTDLSLWMKLTKLSTKMVLFLHSKTDAYDQSVPKRNTKPVVIKLDSSIWW